MKKCLLILMLAVFVPVAVAAVEKPAAREVKKVMDYYNSGQGQGAVLADYTLCREMGKDDQTKNECILLFSGDDIQVGDEIYIWMNFMIPAGDTAEITLGYARNNRIRHTQTLTLKSAFRYRTWKKIMTDKPGDWKVLIYQEMGGTDIDLGSFSYTVKE